MPDTRAGLDLWVWNDDGDAWHGVLSALLIPCCDRISPEGAEHAVVNFQMNVWKGQSTKLSRLANDL